MAQNTVSRMVPLRGSGGGIVAPKLPRTGAFGNAGPVVSGRVVSFLPSPSIGTVAPRLHAPGQYGVPPVFTGGRASFGPTALPSSGSLNQNFIGPKH